MRGQHSSPFRLSDDKQRLQALLGKAGVARRVLRVLLVVWSSVLSQAGATEMQLPELVTQPDHVELTTAAQRIAFTRRDGAFVPITFVRDHSDWRPLFDAQQPLLAGPLLDWQPTRYSVLKNTPTEKMVEFASEGPGSLPFRMRVGASAASPLFHITLTCELSTAVMLDEVPQPIALWMSRDTAAFHLDQGPDSIYGSAGVPHNYGFPAAYLWDRGCEAAVFFNMTPMRWMRPDGVARFHDVRIMTRSESGRTGLGLHFKKLSGRQIPAGEMHIEFFVHQAPRPARPTGLEALNVMIGAFAPLHPTALSWPIDQRTGEPARWDVIARQAMADLMTAGKTMAVLPAPWRDQPLELVAAQRTMLVHPATVMAEAEQVQQQWDFSTVNNHLTPWLLLARLQGDAEALAVGLQKANALPRFYDPQSQLMRHGTRQPPHVGDLEMCWQNLFFHTETLRAASATGAADFNPAVTGRALMGTRGLRQLAARVDYVFPQWFDPYRKAPAVQNDVPQLGVVREPWQVGIYAHVMCSAFQITGQQELWDEARRAVETLMEQMQYRVQNEVYDRQYSNPAEMPITELFGNAHGIAAAYRMYQSTGDEKFLRYSRDFLNTLLRLTFWYEDESDAVSRELRNAGLFYPHGGAHVATPWETAEAHLLIAWLLKHDRQHPHTELLLKLSNLNRTHAFDFFPAVWSPLVRAHDPAERPQLEECFPIEPFYCLEGPGGHRGPTAAYMAGLALWNCWLYEALAEASDHEVMVLNLDVLEDYERALRGDERHLLAYNPGPEERRFQVRCKHLPNGDYSVAVGEERSSQSAEQLQQGLPVVLGPRQWCRITLRRTDVPHRDRELEQLEVARNALAHAYQLLQETATEAPEAVSEKRGAEQFADALAAFRGGRYVEAGTRAKQIIGEMEDARR